MKNISARIQKPNRLPLSMRFAPPCQRAQDPPRQRGGKIRIAESLANFIAENKNAHEDSINQPF